MDPKKKSELLKSLPLAVRLSSASLKDLIQVLQLVPVAKGRTIFEEGSAGDSLFLIGEGRVRIEKKAGGGTAEQKTLAQLGPGDFFGEMALIEESPRSARAIAETDAVLFKLEKKALFGWLQSDPVGAVNFFAEMIRVLSQRLRRTTQELTLLSDLSHLMLEKHVSRQEFVSRALQKISGHLEGAWSAGAYLYNEFNQETEQVAAEGLASHKLPSTLPGFAENPDAWMNASTYRVTLPGGERPLGYLLFQNAALMSSQEKNDLAVTLTAVGRLLSSCLENIQHQEEALLKARLKTAHEQAL